MSVLRREPVLAALWGLGAPFVALLAAFGVFDAKQSAAIGAFLLAAGPAVRTLVFSPATVGNAVRDATEATASALGPSTVGLPGIVPDSARDVASTIATQVISSAGLNPREK